MRYAMITTVDMTDVEGNFYAANTVVNSVIWDGVTLYNPGANMKLIKSDTLNIGDTYNG